MIPYILNFIFFTANGKNEWSRDYENFGLLLNFYWGHAVAQLVEALCYKSEGRGFDSRCCHWIFSLT